MFLRYIFIYICLPITYLGAGILINIVQCLLYFGLRPFNLYLYRKINYYLSYSHHSLIIFFYDWYSESELNICIDGEDYKKYLGKEHAYIIMNHRYEVDWLVVLALAEKFHCAGNLKAYMKKNIQYLPALGWTGYFSENIFLERSFEKDQQIIQKQVSNIMDYPDPFWLLLLPEGTRYTLKKYETSLKVTQEKGLPELKHHLSPRTKGFLTSLPPMHGKMGAIYDLTLSFNPNYLNLPKLINIIMGRKIEANLYIKRIPFDQVPKDETESSKFLYEMFAKKDKLLDSFYKTGDYFKESGIEKVNKFTLGKSYYVLFNYMFWFTSIMGVIVYYLIKLLLSANLYTLIIMFIILAACCFLFKKVIDFVDIKNGSSYGEHK